MVQRVNFLERGKYTLTYQNMALVTALWFFCCLLVQGAMVLHGIWTKAKLQGVEKAEQMFNEEFHRQLQLAQVSKSHERTGTAIQSLASVFEQLPPWSQALTQMAAVVPSQVWLTIVKSVGTPDDNRRRHINIEGRGRSAEAITQFMQKLDETTAFENVALSRSSKDAEPQELIFTIAADLVF